MRLLRQLWHQYVGHPIIAACNRHFWIHDRALWLQQVHCWLGHPGSYFNVCRYCIEVGCAWCRIRFIRNIEARKPESGWTFKEATGWQCPACHEVIQTALTWEPVKPTDDYES